MTEQEQIREIAELDGWTDLRLTIKGSGAPGRRPSWHGKPPCKNYEVPCNHYLTSRDAIVPVIEKHFVHVYQWLDFERELAKVLKICNAILYSRDAIRSTPAQLCEALLRATGKWKE